MTTHELAAELLKLPDIPVLLTFGGTDSEVGEVEGCETYSYGFWSGTGSGAVFKQEPSVILSPW